MWRNAQKWPTIIKKLSLHFTEPSWFRPYLMQAEPDQVWKKNGISRDWSVSLVLSPSISPPCLVYRNAPFDRWWGILVCSLAVPVTIKRQKGLHGIYFPKLTHMRHDLKRIHWPTCGPSSDTAVPSEWLQLAAVLRPTLCLLWYTHSCDKESNSNNRKKQSKT